MLNCCKSEPKRSKQQSYQSPKLQYKYSFKQKSHVLVNSQASSPTTHFDEYQLAPNRDQQYLIHEYERLRNEQQHLELTVRNELRPLENEVGFYEAEVKNRQREIRQLVELLDVVFKSRKPSQQKVTRMPISQQMSRPNLLLYK